MSLNELAFLEFLESNFNWSKQYHKISNDTLIKISILKKEEGEDAEVPKELIETAKKEIEYYDNHKKRIDE